MLSKEDFNNWKVGMTVCLKKNNQPMTVVGFYMDDFCEDHFCDRVECTWFDGNELKKEIYNYDDIDLIETPSP